MGLIDEALSGLVTLGVFGIDEFDRHSGAETLVHALPDGSHAAAAQQPRTAIFLRDELSRGLEFTHRNTA